MVAKNARFRSNNDKLSLSDTAYSPHHGYRLMCSLMCLILLGSPIRLFCQQSQPAKHPQGALENHTLENRWLKAVSTTIAAVFLPTVGKHGYATMFFGFAACTVIYFVTAAVFLPETKRENAGRDRSAF